MTDSTLMLTTMKQWIPTKRQVFKGVLWTLAVLLLIGIGVMAALIPRASDSNALEAALQHVERGSIPDETPEYAALVEQESKVAPDLRIAPGSYQYSSNVNGVDYNIVLQLHDGGKYDYQLSVGNERVHKTYGHSGRWWIDGKVLHTVLTKGDKFLAAPAARDSATPSRERITQVGEGGFTLKAHYGPEVAMTKVQAQ